LDDTRATTGDLNFLRVWPQSFTTVQSTFAGEEGNHSGSTLLLQVYCQINCGGAEDILLCSEPHHTPCTQPHTTRMA